MGCVEMAEASAAGEGYTGGSRSDVQDGSVGFGEGRGTSAKEEGDVGESKSGFVHNGTVGPGEDRGSCVTGRQAVGEFRSIGKSLAVQYEFSGRGEGISASKAGQDFGASFMEIENFVGGVADSG